MSGQQGARIRFCSQCGADVDFDEPTCPVCGHVEGGWPAPDGPPTACDACGADVPAERAYCPGCGALQIAAPGLVPEAAAPAPDADADAAPGEAFARTIVLVAPTLLLGALTLALA